MPELAEVEYFRKQWAVALGERVTAVQVNGAARIFRGTDSAAPAKALKGKPLSLASAHGKQMLFRFGTTEWLGVHLGMAGKLAVAGKDHAAGPHEHLLLRTARRTLVFSDYRMFGRVRHHSGSVPDWWRDLPPQPMDAGFTRERMEAFLDRRARAPIKAVLLMQEAFPGVGNWMADEILWRSRIRPDTTAGRIGPRKRGELFKVIREVCDDALRVIGTDWGDPPESWLFPHRWKDGGTCPKTGCPLRRETIGGRTTCWSPAWQRYGGKAEG